MSPNPQETADLVRFTEEIFNGKIHFLYNENSYSPNSCNSKNDVTNVLSPWTFVHHLIRIFTKKKTTTFDSVYIYIFIQQNAWALSF